MWRKRNSTNFIRSDDGKEILVLDDLGYKLSETQKDLTPLQRAFLIKGHAYLMEEKNKVLDAELKKY